MDRDARIPEDIKPHLMAAREKARGMGLPLDPMKRRLYLQGMQEEFATPGNSRYAKMFSKTGAQQPSDMGMHGGAVRAVWPKRYDPLASPTNRDIPYYADDDAYEDADTMKLARAWCRFYYATHHIVPTAVDIFARYPLVGMEHQCKDEGITRYYDDLFLGDLEYEEYLVKLGLEYWKTGEAFPMGDWDENLGCWTDDVLMNPDDIVVEQNLMLKTHRYKFKVPDYMKELLTRPPNEGNAFDSYEALLSMDSQLLDAIKNDEYIEIDPFNITQLKHGGNPWSARGYPILMRAFRQLLLEERLNRAQLAISERLYTPLILLLLGEKSLGEDGEPWIPTQSDINRTQVLFENIMESEYRTLVHHFGLDIQVPLQGERLPNLDPDYERIERALLGVFGISPDLLFGGRGGQSYASTAISAEFLLQRLNTYQSMIRGFLKKRYEAVASAQGFYDYEMKGKTKIDIYEQVLVKNPDGSKSVKTRKKLLIPTVKFRTIDFRDEDMQRSYMMEMKSMGIFISDKRIAQGIEIDPEEERERMVEEQVDKAMTNARIKKEIVTQAALEGLTEYIDEAYLDPVTQMETPPPTPPMGGLMQGEMGENPGAPEGMQAPGPQAPSQSSERAGDAAKFSRKANALKVIANETKREDAENPGHSHYAEKLYKQASGLKDAEVRRVISTKFLDQEPEED